MIKSYVVQAIGYYPELFKQFGSLKNPLKQGILDYQTLLLLIGDYRVICLPVAYRSKSMAADRQFTWDADFPGFGIQTTQTGHKSFVYQYRAGSISRRMKLDGSWFRYEAVRAGKPAPALRGTPRAVAKREAEA